MQVRTIALSACLAVAQLVVPGLVRAQYQVTNLVSNQEKTAKNDGSAPGQRLGPHSRSRQSLVGQRRRLRLVHTLR
jgi:hypothetical protein